MSRSNLTYWIEDADAREISRDATFEMGDQQKQYLHLGAIIIKVTECWHRRIAKDVRPLHCEPRTYL